MNPMFCLCRDLLPKSSGENDMLVFSLRKHFVGKMSQVGVRQAEECAEQMLPAVVEPFFSVFVREFGSGNRG